MKPKTFRYTQLRKVTASNIFEFTAIEDLARFAETNHLKDIFVLSNGTGEQHFAIMHHNSVIQHLTMGFNTIEDYYAATENKFPDAASYYDALKEGYNSYEHYRMIKEAGITDKAEFDKMNAGGFIEGYKKVTNTDEWNQINANNDITSAYKLYLHALEQGFESFYSWSVAARAGFTDKDTYDVAKEYGFTNLADYEDARRRSFKTFADLQAARELQVRDYSDMRRYFDLKSVDCNECAFDERVLLTLLSKIEQGKKISINKLMDLLEKSIKEYCYEDTQEMPAWFTRAFHDKEAVISFLSNNEEVKKFGTYDNDGEFFEINHMKDRKVVLDGSNVAHNSHGSDRSKPAISNIIKVVQFLKRNGFTEISVIADASLKHKLHDADKLSELKDIAEYLVAPAETSADAFIIRYVKHTHCLLVSNDTFREWKISDPWVAENIDYYRLSFMIKGDEVLMPDIK